MTRPLLAPVLRRAAQNLRQYDRRAGLAIEDAPTQDDLDAACVAVLRGYYSENIARALREMLPDMAPADWPRLAASGLLAEYAWTLMRPEDTSATAVLDAARRDEEEAHAILVEAEREYRRAAQARVYREPGEDRDEYRDALEARDATTERARADLTWANTAYEEARGSRMAAENRRYAAEHAAVHNARLRGWIPGR